MLIGMYGCLEVSHNKKKGLVSVTYLGSMGSSPKDGKECFDGLYGKGSWETLNKVKSKQTHSDWTYIWSVDVVDTTFFKNFKRTKR